MVKVEKIVDDFDLGKIAESGQCFRWELIEDGSYRVISGGDCLYIRDLGDSRYEFDCNAAAFGNKWDSYFDLDLNYARVRSKIKKEKDPFLFEAAEHEKGIRILKQEPFEILISFIISQNRNIPAIRNSVELLAKACGDVRQDSRGETYYAFPKPEAIAALSEEDLTDCKLGYRTKYVKAAAEAVKNGEIDLRALKTADYEKAMEELKKLYGVGEKVANCVALFGLHHINAFPKDVWIKRVLETEYPEGYPFTEYSPYNGIYQQYMFAYYRNGGKE